MLCAKIMFLFKSFLMCLSLLPTLESMFFTKILSSIEEQREVVKKA